MDGKVLVAFASVYGATEEIAQTVAGVLREKGLDTDLLPARAVRSLDGYSAVVLGAPLYMFHLHKDAQRFLSRFRGPLSSGIPIAVFGGGPFGKGEESEWQEVRKEMDSEMAKFPWLSPVSVEVVGGRFDPAKLRFPYSLIPALKQMPANDLRDWDAIHAWAGGLTEKFHRAAA